MDAISVTGTRIHCDTCHCEFVGEVPEWHNKPCPQCNAENIITDADMAIWLGMRDVMAAVNGLVGDIPDDHGGGHVILTLDTAGLSSNAGIHRAAEGRPVE